MIWQGKSASIIKCSQLTLYPVNGLFTFSLPETRFITEALALSTRGVGVGTGPWVGLGPSLSHRGVARGRPGWASPFFIFFGPQSIHCPFVDLYFVLFFVARTHTHTHNSSSHLNNFPVPNSKLRPLQAQVSTILTFAWIKPIIDVFDRFWHLYSINRFLHQDIKIYQMHGWVFFLK